jgi:hypothetical protein
LVEEGVDEGASDGAGRSGDQEHDKPFACTGTTSPAILSSVQQKIRKA